MAQKDKNLLELALEKLRESAMQVGKSVLWDLHSSFLRRDNDWILVVDGIDECPPRGNGLDRAEGRAGFLTNLWRAIAGTHTRVLVVSRDEPDIRLQFGSSSKQRDEVAFYKHRLVIEDVESDVLAFCKRVAKIRLANKSAAIHNEIAEKMAAKSEGMFLCVDLHQRNQSAQWQEQNAIAPHNRSESCWTRSGL